MTFLAVAYAYLCAHGPAAVALFLLVAPTLITGLSSYPQASNFIGFLKLALNLLSIVSHKDSPGTFKLPLTMSQPAPDSGRVVDLVPPRGFARLGLLMLLSFGILLIASAARAADVKAPNPNALADTIAQDPAAVQPAPDPMPVPSQFGGCVAKGRVCFAPSVSIAVGAINLRTKKIEPAFMPGLGYGFTVAPGKWSSFGVDGYFTMDPGAGQASVSLLAKLFNGYMRVGYSKGFLGDTAPRLLFATGIDVP